MTLTPKVQQRVMVMMALERGQLLMAEAAQLLGRCVRQVRRLRSGYRVRGPAALVHGNQGRQSPRRTAAPTRQRVVTLAQRTYPGVKSGHHNADMRTTLNIETSLIRRAARLTGVSKKTALVRMGLEALIARESAHRLAKLGGTEPSLRAIRRRRSGRVA